MDSEASCRSTVVSDDELERSEEGVRTRDDDCCCCSCVSCPPHLFTSVLLGLLACVLVSGGVFLAFHKWDHTWLLVSAVGVLLMAIGTALHCCSAAQAERKNSHRCKGGCGSNSGRSKPDTFSSNGMLAEQLLPLSNARSVSQLSLNMVPGYFPPLVYSSPNTPYGLEQHSAVVQNISRLVQHQQQLHLQAPSPTDGTRSFILVPLPADANATNIQNLVAAVCQMDANNSSDHGREGEPQTQTAASTTQAPAPVTATTPRESAVISTSPAQSQSVQSAPSSCLPIVKHVEVQTCYDWPNPPLPERKTEVPNSSASASALPTTSGASRTVDFSCQAVDAELGRRGNSIPCSSSTSTGEQGQSPEVQELNCPEPNLRNAICDTDESASPNAIPPQLMDTSGQTTSLAVTTEPAASSSIPPEEHMAVNSGVPHSSNEAPVTSCSETREDPDVEDDSTTSGVFQSSEDSAVCTGATAAEEAPEEALLPANASSNTLDSQFDDNSENFSDLEEAELLERSSPPPSYDDVTQEEPRSTLGAFALVYGTM